MKVLLVDDNETDRTILKINFSHHNCLVLEASNGKEALDLIKLEKPDLIVSDLMMPEMDGYELLWNLKSDDSTKNIPLIFYSAVYVGEKDIQLAKLLGAEEFIIKPDDPIELYQKILNIYENSKTRVKQLELKELINETDFLRTYSKIVASKLVNKVYELNDLNKRYFYLYELYHTLLDAIPDIILAIDTNFNVVCVNKAFEEFFSLASNEIVGKSCITLLNKEIFDCKECPVKKVFQTREKLNFEIKLKNGKILDVRAIPIFFQNEINQVVIILRDITEQRRLLEQFMQSQKMEEIGILAGIIAHDFRNMLTPILGFSDLIKMHVDKNSNIYKYAESIAFAAEKTSSLISGLLAFAKKQQVEFKPININDIIRNFTKIITRMIGEDIKLITTLNAPDCKILGDPTQIQQVILNIVTNARDAMPQGGTLTIKTELINLNQKQIDLLEGKSEGQYILLSISDTGIGMPEEVKARIFEPFFTTKAKDKGSGLGLSVVKGIIKQHNGIINVISSPGEGTTFEIYFPVPNIDLAKEEITPEDELLNYKGNGELILLIEDEDEVRKFLKNLFESTNYKVIEAANGRDGIEVFKKHKNDIKLVIIDIILPELSGLQVINELKKLNSEIKYIFLSGYTTDTLFERFNTKLNDSDIYVLKPVKPHIILKKMHSLLKS